MTDDRRVTNESDASQYAVLPDEGGGYQVPDDPNRGPVILLLALGVVAVFGVVVWNAYKQGVRESETAVLPKIVSQGAFKTTPTAQERVAGLELQVLDEVSGDDRADLEFVSQSVREEPVELAQDSTEQNEGGLSSREISSSQSPQSIQTEMIGNSGAPVDLLSGAGAKAKTTIPQPKSKTQLVEEEIKKSAVAIADRPIQKSKSRPEPVSEPEFVPVTSSSGTFYVQLAAVKSTEAVNAVWRKASNKSPKLFEKVVKDIQTVDLGAKGVWHRIQAGRFDSRANANAFCSKFKADGGDCIVAERK